MGVTCREVTVEMSLMRPSSSFRLYPSGRLSLSLTFHNLMVLSEKQTGPLSNQIYFESVKKESKVLVDRL